MPTPATVIFLKQHLEVSPIELIIQDEVKKRGFGFKSVLELDASETEKRSPVIARMASETELDTKLAIEAYREKNPQSTILLIGSPNTVPQTNDPRTYTLTPDSKIETVAAIVEQLKTNLRARPHILLLSASDPRTLKEAFEREDGIVTTLHSQDIKSTQLDQYKHHGVPFDFIVIEGHHIKPLLKPAIETFPHASVIGIGDGNDARFTYSKGGVFIKKDNHTSNAIHTFVKKTFQHGTDTLNTRGKCYIIAGPTAAGKSEAVFHMHESFPEVITVQKDMTRLPRPEEIAGRHAQFISKKHFAYNVRGKKYFLTYSVNNERYGIREQVIEQLDRGRDILLTVTDPKTLSPIISKFNDQRRNSTIPILFFADPDTLAVRLVNREGSLKEKENRLHDLKSNYEQFLANRNLFKYGINTTVSGQAKVQSMLEAIVEWEHEHEGEDYARTILRKVLPHNFLTMHYHREKITLTINPSVLEAYGTEKQMHSDELKKFRSLEVKLSSGLYGRIGVWLEEPKIHESSMQPREIILDLIEKTVGLKSRARNNSKEYLPLTVFGKGNDTLTAFNDGILYQLGDDLIERSVKSDPYAVTFGFAKTNGKFYRIKPIDERALETWTQLPRMLEAHPLRAPSTPKPSEPQ